MTDIGNIFTRLGLEQYLDAFIVEGFDSWETVLDIQEGDLEALNVKLGHRRKLQREIANYRGESYERSLGSPITETSADAGKNSDQSSPPSGQHERSGAEIKRKYRRHPKPDKNAPERPPSAYVIFSNKVREEVKAQNLSFTSIAKLVGERWQNLDPEEKEPFEVEANRAKERFKVDLAQYKKSQSYKEYIQYIADFKAKHSGTTSEGKRLKVEQEVAGGASFGQGNEASYETRARHFSTHAREVSGSSAGTASHPSNLSSPEVVSTGLSLTSGGYGTSGHLSHTSTSHMATSPSHRAEHHGRRFSPLASVHASNPTEAHQRPRDYPVDLQSRTGQLFLGPTLGGMVSSTADSLSASGAALPPPPPPPLPLPSQLTRPLSHHQSSSVSSNSVAPSDSSANSNAIPVTFADEPWGHSSGNGKAKVLEWPRIVNSPLSNGRGAPLPQLPLLLPPAERIGDLSGDAAQRTLPFPAPSSPHEVRPPFRGRGPNLTTFLPSESSVESHSQPRGEAKSPLEASESDAANALAGLAYIGR